MTGFGLLFRPLCNPTAYPLSSRPNTHCHPDRTPFVIPAAHPLSSRPQRRDLIQSAGDPSTSLRMTGFGQLPRPLSQSHTHFHPGRTPIVIPTAHSLSSRPQRRDLIQSAGDPSTPLRMTGFGQLPRPLSQPHTLCHPDRSGGISSSRHQIIRLRSGRQRMSARVLKSQI